MGSALSSRELHPPFAVQCTGTPCTQLSSTMPTASCPTNGPYGKFKNRESLDLETLLGEANLPTLLLESTSTLPETASCTSLSCPPFPSTSHSPWLVDDLSGGKDLQNAGPNVPTPPRLRKLAKINRPIRDWAVSSCFHLRRVLRVVEDVSGRTSCC